MTATMQKDGYKEYHRKAGHPGVTKVYLNFTNRSGKHSNVPGSKSVALVGLQYLIKDHLIDEWNKEFFNVTRDDAVKNHKRILSAMLGREISVEYLEELHDLGYLPLKIKAVPEGTMVPYGVASFTIENTIDNFEWLPGAIETVVSTEVWPISTSATTAIAYYKNVIAMAKATGLPEFLVPMMAHDFSMRGMFGKQAGAMSGFGHLSSGLIGTDTISAVLFAEKYYGANVDNEVVGVTVDATEHGVTCQWISQNGYGEEEFYEHLMENITPTGVLSVVWDTRDFWRGVTEFLPRMYDKIMARDGTLVIRPDSGDPVRILCGYKVANITDRNNFYVDPDTDDAVAWVDENGDIKFASYTNDTWPDGSPCNFMIKDELQQCEVDGLVETLWDIFGGITTDQGYKLLDSHIGAIYGDSITLDRQEEIYERLMEKGFVPSVVLGVGSYTYQYVTRDTHGSAVKATSIVKNGEDTAIFKEPKTDLSKKSAKGLLRVDKAYGEIVMYDEQTREEENRGMLETVFLNGVLVKETSLGEIRALIASQI